MPKDKSVCDATSLIGAWSMPWRDSVATRKQGEQY